MSTEPEQKEIGGVEVESGPVIEVTRPEEPEPVGGGEAPGTGTSEGGPVSDPTG